MMTFYKSVKPDVVRVLFYLCLFALGLPAYAGQIDAKTVLDKTAETFRQSGGVRADFVAQTFLNKKLQDSSNGSIQLKGEKFLLEAEGMKTWFNGHTQWSYLESSNEVNLSEPTPEELQSINPYTLLSIYKQGYKLKLGKTEMYRGKPAYEVILTASGKKQDLACIVLYIEKATWQPLCVSMTQRGGGNVVIRIQSYRTGQPYADGIFSFDKKEYPTAEVIDLR